MATMKVSGAIPVAPRTFVKLDSSGKQVVPAGAGDAVFGISGQTAAPPGQFTEVSIGDYELCSIMIDPTINPTTPIRRGQQLKSGPSGGALPGNFATENIGAIAAEPASAPAAGKRIICRVLTIKKTDA